MSRLRRVYLLLTAGLVIGRYHANGQFENTVITLLCDPPKAYLCVKSVFALPWPNDPRHIDHASSDPLVLSTLSLCHTGAHGSVERGTGSGAARDQIER